jgi:iron complex outermembrane receptor protein
VEGFGATTITLGARLQEVRLQGLDLVNPSTSELDRRDREHMLEGGVRRGMGHNWSVFVKGARSVRFATVDELFRPFSVPNFATLEPQIGRGADLGTEYRHGALQSQVSVYYLELDNEIHYNPVTFSNENLDPTRRHGLNFNLSTAIVPQLRVTADYAYTRAEFREGAFAGNEVPLVPTHTASLTLHWKPKSTTDVALAGRYVGSKYFDNDETNTFSQKIPAYEVLDLRLTETLDRWRVQAAVYNIFDKRYFDYGVRSTSSTTTYSAYPMPDRNFMVSLGREF